MSAIGQTRAAFDALILLYCSWQSERRSIFRHDRRLHMHWLVDGMNVIGTRPDGWWRDRDRAMSRLVDQLERWVAETGEDVTVVFERQPSPPIRSSVIEVAHAPHRKQDAADDEIVRRLRANQDPSAVRVVTSDRLLADRANALGAGVEGSDSFRVRIEQ